MLLALRSSGGLLLHSRTAHPGGLFDNNKNVIIATTAVEYAREIAYLARYIATTTRHALNSAQKLLQQLYAHSSGLLFRFAPVYPQTGIAHAHAATAADDQTPSALQQVASACRLH
eukprot:SAG31_NODE_290_length_18324_cov_33.408889_4_plen_116_part_00